MAACALPEKERHHDEDCDRAKGPPLTGAGFLEVFPKSLLGVARVHAAVKRHPGYSEHEFCAAAGFGGNLSTSIRHFGFRELNYRLRT